MIAGALPRVSAGLVAVVGACGLCVALGAIAAVPGIGGLAMGYALAVEGRRARGAPALDALPVLRLAPRVGATILGAAPWLFMWTLVRDRLADARIVGPSSPATGRLETWCGIVTVALAAHLAAAALRGGRLLDFVSPVSSARWLAAQLRRPRRAAAAARARVRDALAELEPLRPEVDLGRFAGLAVGATLGALAWLGPPLALLVAAQRHLPEAGPLLVVAAVVAVPALGWLPLLQARFAAEGRFAALFELTAVRRLVRRAPLATSAAVAATYAATLPVFALRILAPPDRAPLLFFTVAVTAMLAARATVGGLYHRAATRPTEVARPWSWLVRAALLPLLAAYVALMFAVPLVDAEGARGLLLHPAYALPGWP